MRHDKYPLVHKKNKIVEIILKNHEQLGKRVIQTTFVLDFSAENEVIGVEIINFRYTAGPNALANYDWDSENSNKEIHVSYDEDADAFYISLSSDRSFKQGVVEGTLILDSEERVIRMECDPSSVVTE